MIFSRIKYKREESMGKSRCFLGIFVSLFMVFFVGSAAFAAGYNCPTYKKYTSCSDGYYMNGGQVAGNSCVPCNSVSATDLSQSCTRNPTSTELSNAHAAAGTITSASQKCTGNHTGGAGGTDTSTACTGCSSWGTCTGGTFTATSCLEDYYLSSGKCNACTSVSASGDVVSTTTITGGKRIQTCTGNHTGGAGGTGTATACTGCSSSTYSCSCNSGYHVVGSGETCTCAPDNISVQCAAGKYIAKGKTTCDTQCPANSWCAGGSFTIPYTGATTNTGISGTCANETTSPAGSNSYEDCTKSCTVACSGNDTASCPANANCTYDETKKYTGTQHCTNTSCSNLSACSASGTCPLKSFSCKADYYLKSGVCTGCPTNYPNSDGGATAITQCYSNTKQRPWTGSETPCKTPTGCASAKCKTCSLSACNYVAYSNATGTGDGEHKSGCTTNNASCQQEVDTVTAADDHYVNSKTCPACPDTYPNSDGGNISASYCYKWGTKTGSQQNGEIPKNCASVTSWKACQPGTCQYKDYNGATDGTCTPSNCVKDPAAVTAKSGYYDAGTTCLACSTVGDGSYKLSADGNEGGNTKCYKACTRACTQQTCPANATCTHGSQTTSGTQYYGGSCSAAASTCTIEIKCNSGYTLKGNECVANTYTVTYKNGGGTGSDKTQSVTYNANFTTKPASTFTRPGYTFSSWGGSYPNPNQSYKYTTVGNTTLTAQWAACANNPTGENTCDCGDGKYPNGSGCSNCVVSCSSVSGFTSGQYNVCESQTNNICYRNCTISDVANSTAVTGTVTKGGTKTCKPTACKTGYQVSADGTKCELKEYTITLKKNGGTGTINGYTGTTDAKITCKHGEVCTLSDDDALTRGTSGEYTFVGWGTESTCTSGTFQETFTGSATRYACWSQNTTKCESGKYYDGTNHVACPKDSYCTGTGSVNVGTPGCMSECPGTSQTSGTGNSSITACYITCSGGSITNGTRTPVEANPHYTSTGTAPTCKYNASCNPGYKPVNQGTATAACEICEAGEYCPGGGEGPKSCPSGGTSAAGAGAITECYAACTGVITVENSTSVKSDGKKYYDGTKYPACTYDVTCESDYSVQDNHTAAPYCQYTGDCPPGSWCDPDEDNGQPQPCPEGGTSDGTATSPEQCFVSCNRAGAITGGTLTSNASDTDDRQYWNGTEYPACTYHADCDGGYVADNQDTATATCIPCDGGDKCPGGDDEYDPDPCDEDWYCEPGKEPKQCPDNGKSEQGSDSITDCYQPCAESITISNGTTTSTGDAYYKIELSGYPQCTWTANCNEGYEAQNSPGTNPSCTWADPDACPKNHYCPPESGEKIPCPDDEYGNQGFTETTGATSPTQCYHDYDPYSGFKYGTAGARCFYQTISSKYDNCSVSEVHTCIGGYWYDSGMECSPTSSGTYSPDGNVNKIDCPKNPTGGSVASSAQADSFTQCYMACELDVDNASTVAATNPNVYGISATEYQACEYTVTCNTGYTVQNNKSENPTCQANKYTITLDKNGGTGNTPATIQCTFDSGACELPDTDGLTRPGYTGQRKWCTNKDGTGTCHYAGQSTTANISSTGTNITLYAVWVPNVYTVNLNHQDADVAGAPATVYLKYATGWFSNQGATSGISKLSTVPTKTGYEFAGYYSAISGGVPVINSTGVFQVTENALTFTTNEPATIYARWSAGTTHCDAGTYYTGTGTTCAPCEANNYCPGGDFATDSGTPEGMESCPENGLSPSESESATACYKTGLDYTATHGAGTQTCNWDTSARSYSAKCQNIKIDMCDAGYWLEDADNDTDCTAVGIGNYSGDEQITRNACPNGGTTDTDTASSVQECFKTGLDYSATHGSGKQTCFYSFGEGADAVYQRDCHTQTIEKCWAGYYLAAPADTDCTPVGQTYYSGEDELERHQCPANSTTGDETTAGSITRCRKDRQPVTTEHGAGERTCFYTGGEGDDAYFTTNCQKITMTSCHAGYWYDYQQAAEDCVAVGIGYYSVVNEMQRHMCPDNGTTKTTTSATSAECYRDDMACDIENGFGEQTCNYNEADDEYTLNCQTCYVTSCESGFSQVGNTCIECPEDSVCEGGEQKTCASLTDGQYPNSDPGTEDVALCYRDCALAENAAAMDGRDYYDSTDTCEIARCAAGYTLDNGQCIECPEGSFCDGETDPENPGDDVKSCADVGDGSWPLSQPGAQDEHGCYQTCEAYEIINGTAEPVSDKAFYPNECEYEGVSDTGNPCEIIDGECVETMCLGGYEMIDGVCEPCDREYALSYKNTGVCQIAQCVLGYHPIGDRCEPNVQECTAPNAVYAEKTWNTATGAFGSCMIKECEYGYHIASNACVSDIQPCNVENGTGFKEWDSDINDWGKCVATQCNPGYTNDPSETNELTKQCGECKNKYSVMGKLAASSYIQGCEIASCMYQGELYNLENNECVPICPMTEYEDETGTMVWDDVSKKCVRTCNEGYTMW